MEVTNEDVLILLELLYGTEKQIRIRRYSTVFCEKIESITNKKPIFRGGSYVEGVRYPFSDIDTLHVVNDIFDFSFHYSNDDNIWSCERPLAMSSKSKFPGVVTLQVPDLKSYNKLPIVARRLFVKEEEKYFLSSKKFIESWKSEPGQYIHGPCTSGNIGNLEYDHTFGFHCEFWPNEALEWRTRQRLYPTEELMTKIINTGFHLVPVGSRLSRSSNIEWRISFCLAERILIFEFNQIQFMIYNLLKDILKSIIDVAFPDVLSSYFIKTTMFWVMEDILDWSVNQLENCFTACLTKLKEFVLKLNCPNYFIPANNMFLRKVKKEKQQPLLKLLDALVNKGLRIIFEYGIYEGITEMPTAAGIQTIIESNTDFDCFDEVSSCVIFIDDALKLCLSVKQITLSFLRLLQINEDVLSEMTQEEAAKCISKTIEKYLYMSFSSANHSLVSRKEMEHKRTDEVYKSIEDVMVEGQDYDMAAGKLIYANFLYWVGKTKEALGLLKQVNDTYTPSIYYMQTKNMEEYIPEFCGKDIPLDLKLQKAYSDSVRFTSESKYTAPEPIQYMIHANYDRILLDPLVFSYFLSALCHKRTENKYQYDLFVSKLDTIICNDKFSSEEHRGWSYLLLGYLKQHQGRYLRALMDFGNGLKYEDKRRRKHYKSRFQNPAFFYIFLTGVHVLKNIVACGFNVWYNISRLPEWRT